MKSLSSKTIGLKENLLLFSMLVITNFFVGAMVGLERTVLPILGEEVFGLTSTSTALSFITSFGVAKALINLCVGPIADRIGRRKVLLLSWGIGLWVPLLIIYADSWWMIVFANVLLGIHQGLAWSMTLNMKIDIVKANQSGLAIGLNQFAGYTGVGLFAAISGYISAAYSLRPEPFYLGIVIAVIGFLLSLAIRDTGSHLKIQAQLMQKDTHTALKLSTREVFLLTTWKDKSLASCSFAGLVTNLKDGMAWGLFPLFFIASGLSVGQTATLIALYPAAWGVFQLFTGALSDRIGRKGLIVGGMLLQSLTLWWILWTEHYGSWIAASVILGLATAMVYPTLQAVVSDVAHPNWRASSLGVYRSWRDSGYVFGAMLSGLFSDLLNISWAIGMIALLPAIAGMIAAIRLKETLVRS